MTPFEPEPCDTCIHDEKRPMTRREILRHYGVKGLVLSAAGALGLAGVHKASAGYMYMGHVYINCYCISGCREDCQYCEYWRNEFGQVQYRNCIFDRHNTNRCGGTNC
jgi:hypothetical protein